MTKRSQQNRAIRSALNEARAIGLQHHHRARLAYRRNIDKEKQVAEKIERSPFTPFLNGFSYDQAFDGNIWRLVKGEDFEQAPNTVAGKLREEFAHRYGELQIRQDDDVLTIRRVPGTRD